MRIFEPNSALHQAKRENENHRNDMTKGDRDTVKFGNNEIEGTEFLARYRRYSLLPTAAVEEFSLTEPLF